PLYNTINFSAGLQTEYLKPYMRQEAPLYRCPSDGGSPLVEHALVVTTSINDGDVTPATTDAASTFARSNYFGMAGYLQADFGGLAFDEAGEPPASGPHINQASLGNQGRDKFVNNRYCHHTTFGGIFNHNSRVGTRDIKDGTSNTIMLGE